MEGSDIRWRRSRGLLRHGPLSSPPFRLLLVGQSVSNVGNYVYTIAFPWLILSRHGGVALLGLVITSGSLSRVAAIPLGGWFTDRLSSWRVMLWSDCGQIVVGTALAVCAFTLAPSLAWLLPLEVSAGFLGGLLIPSSMSVVPALLPEEQANRGVALFAGGMQLAGVFGPALGGALVALAGAPSALAIDVGSYVVSTLSLLGIMRYTTALDDAGDEAAEDDDEDASSADAEQHVSFGYFVRRAHLLKVILGMSVIFYLTYPGVEEVALPTLAHQDFGASGFGALLTVEAVGSLLGTVLAGRYAEIKAVPYLQSSLLAVLGLALAFIPYAGGLPGALVAMSVFAVAVGWQGVGITSMIQSWTPGHLLGRTMSALMTVTQGISPASVIVVTVLVRNDGAGLSFVLAGTASVLVAIGLFCAPVFRSYRLGDRFAKPLAEADMSDDVAEHCVVKGSHDTTWDPDMA